MRGEFCLGNMEEKTQRRYNASYVLFWLKSCSIVQAKEWTLFTYICFLLSFFWVCKVFGVLVKSVWSLPEQKVTAIVFRLKEGGTLTAAEHWTARGFYCQGLFAEDPPFNIRVVRIDLKLDILYNDTRYGVSSVILMWKLKAEALTWFVTAHYLYVRSKKIKT